MVLQLCFEVTGPDVLLRLSSGREMPAIDREFRGEHQPAVDRGHKRELISVGPEAQGSFKFLCSPWSLIEANVRSALLGEEGLNTLLKESTEHSEETDEITLSSSVRTDQDIYIPEFEGGAGLEMDL